MDQILEYCKGAIGITDDVTFHGKDDKEDNWNLHKFTCEHGLDFSREKCKVKKNLVMFFDTAYDADAAVHQMSPPETPHHNYSSSWEWSLASLHSFHHSLHTLYHNWNC